MTAMIRVSREPLALFLLLGTLVFVVFSLLDDTPQAPDAGRIVVTPAVAARLAQGFEAVWRRPPTPTELEGLIDDHIREEVFVREALALGLDRNDTVVRQRLRQKMEFLTTSAAGTVEPREAELRAYFEAHSERYKIEPRIAFEQVFLGETARELEVETVLGALKDGAAPAETGARTLLPTVLPLSTRVAVDGMFGDGFFAAVGDLAVGSWGGPIRSGYGVHVVRPSEIAEARLPPFETVREAVRDDWQLARLEALGKARFEELRARYRIERPDLSAMEMAGP